MKDRPNSGDKIKRSIRPASGLALPEERPAEPSSVSMTSKMRRSPVLPVVMCGVMMLTAAGIGACSASSASAPSGSDRSAVVATGDQESDAATHYANAVRESQNGNIDKAIEEFRLAGDYQDAKKLLTDLCIAQGDKAVEEGNPDKALEYYKIAGEYQDVSEKTSAVAYAQGVAARKNGKYKEAVEFFTRAGEYKDAAEQLGMCYYSLAEEELQKGKTDLLAGYYRKAGNYKDAVEKAKQYSYEDGVYFFKKGDFLSAAGNFEYAGDYKDAQERVKISYYKLGMECLKNKDYEHAEDYLEYAGNYKDAAAKLKEANYYLGAEALKNGQNDYAVEYFKAAGNYKNAKKRLSEVSYKMGLESLRNKDFEKAKKYFSKCGKYRYAKDLAKACSAEILYGENKIGNAANEYKQVSSKVKVEGFNIQGRKREITQEAVFARVEGDWKAKSNNTYVKNTKRKFRYKRRRTRLVKSKKWYLKSLASGQYLEISYYKNDDGTFDYTVKACFVHFLKFAASRKNLDTDYYEVEKTFEGLKKFPTSIKLDKNVTVKYKKGKFTLYYARHKGYRSNYTQFRSTVKFKKSYK